MGGNVPVRVAVRVRPPLTDIHLHTNINNNGDSNSASSALAVEVHAPSNATDSASINTGGSKRPVATGRAWRFDACFGGEASQEEVFRESGVPELVDAALDGYSATVFAFGQTGSGKTHTLTGQSGSIFSTNGGSDPNDGVVARALAQAYATIEQRREHTSYAVKVSVAEIYNEKITDLLTSKVGPPLPIRSDRTRGFYVKGLTFGKAWFVDLAGSERLRDTGSAGTLAVREAGKINRSLFSLSKLLIDSLHGTGRALLLACCSPLVEHAEETAHTLHFASLAMRVASAPVVSLDPHNALVQRLKSTIADLKEENKSLSAKLVRMSVHSAETASSNNALMDGDESVHTSHKHNNNSFVVNHADSSINDSRSDVTATSPLSRPTVTKHEALRRLNNRRPDSKKKKHKRMPRPRSEGESGKLLNMWSLFPDTTSVHTRDYVVASSLYDARSVYSSFMGTAQKHPAPRAHSHPAISASWDTASSLRAPASTLTSSYHNLPTAPASIAQFTSAPPPPPPKDLLRQFPALADLEDAFRRRLNEAEATRRDAPAGTSVADDERNGHSYNTLHETTRQYVVTDVACSTYAPTTTTSSAPTTTSSPQRPEPKAAAWARRNTWFGRDKELTAYAYKVHDVLVGNEGIDPASDMYYQGGKPGSQPTTEHSSKPRHPHAHSNGNNNNNNNKPSRPHSQAIVSMSREQQLDRELRRIARGFGRVAGRESVSMAGAGRSSWSEFDNGLDYSHHPSSSVQVASGVEFASGDQNNDRVQDGLERARRSAEVARRSMLQELDRRLNRQRVDWVT
eukprot:jgi/Chlat1/2347/Chrsp17S02806